MKKLLPALLFLFAGIGVQAQNSNNRPLRTCGVMDHEAMLQQKNPNRAAERTAYEELLQHATERQSPNSVQSVKIIPVVVHVLYSNSAQNISANQILSQIEVLNQDFTRTNADASQTPSAFASVAGNPGMQFCLAKQDPNGNWTDGIERRQTTVSSFSDSNDGAKFYSTGGLDAWDPTHYFNIWVCNLGSFLLGYAEFPTGSSSNTFGVVIGYSFFGSNYTSYGSGFSLDPYYNRGRTTTHEIGHCFNLFHIWGDDGGSCSGSDLCADTPNQGSETYGAPSFPQTDNCSSTSPGYMFMNYMDYTDDVAMNMFTVNQCTRMNAVTNSGPYAALLTSNVCTPAGVASISGNVLGANVFPNPSSNGHFTLTVDLAGRSDMTIRISNSLGQLVKTISENNTYGGSYEVDLSAEADGVYFVEISAGEETNVQRVLINR